MKLRRVRVKTSVGIRVRVEHLELNLSYLIAEKAKQSFRD
jgi:hypothetical protein